MEKEVLRPLPDEQVTDYTAKLWQYRPLPLTEPETHSECAYKMYSFSAYQVLAARVRGKKHKHDGSHCDDWYEVGHIGEWLLLAVADGAGSKRLSRIGAREACRAAVASLRESVLALLAKEPNIEKWLSGPLEIAAFRETCGMLADCTQGAVLRAEEAVRQAYLERADAEPYLKLLGRKPCYDDFSATLAVVLFIPLLVNHQKEYFITACQVGDGMIAAINTQAPFSKALKILSNDHGGQFRGETEFLNSAALRQPEFLQKRTRVTRGFTDIVLLMTDGVAEDYFPYEREIKRLYLDLLFNGIIEETREAGYVLNASTSGKLERVPAPLSYPWVDDPQTFVPLHYTRKICEGTGLTLEFLWENREFCSLVAEEKPVLKRPVNRSERLKIWLDNYVQRGSFDDRTLVIVQA